TELWREFEVARPRILGALLDAAVCGLQTLPNVFVSAVCRGWQTLPCGSRLSGQHRGLGAPLGGPLVKIAKTQSKTLSSWTRWQFASANSWRNVAVGREPPRIFCVSSPILQVTMSGKEAQAGPKILAPSPAGCVVRRRFFACWVLK